MTTPNYPYVWYWVVGDTNPTTQVFESSSGTYVANTAANYLSWVLNGGQTSPFYQQPLVSNVADNGAGLVRVTAPTAKMTTNDVWAVQGVVMTGATVVNGARAITVIDANNFDIQGSTFVGGDTYVSGGVADRGAPIATDASLRVLINNWNLSIWAWNQTTFSGAGPYTIATPASALYILALTGTTRVILPPADTFGSPPLGQEILIANAGAATITVFLSDGVTQQGLNVYQGQQMTVGLITNASGNGTWLTQLSTARFWRPDQGGTGSVIGPTDAQIPIADSTATPGRYLPRTISGDLTNNDTGVFTLASTITAGGPTGDASHVAQITYDAKGRLTAVTSVAISGTAPGGSAGGDLSGTYPNPTVAKVDGVSYPASPSTNTVPVVTSANTITYETVPVAAGGTGATTFTAHGVLLGEGTSAIVPTAIMTNGQLLVGQSAADPLPKTVSGDATMAASGALTVTGLNGASYATGSWTPVDGSGASLTFTSATGNYVKIGTLVVCFFRVVYPVTVNGSTANIGGLPFTVAADGGLNYMGGFSAYSSLTFLPTYLAINSTTGFDVTNLANLQTNAQLSTADLRGVVIYHI